MPTRPIQTDRRGQLSGFGRGNPGWHLPPQAGFGLPVVLVLLVVLSLVGTASYLVTRNEWSAGRSIRVIPKSFYAAEAGLAMTIDSWDYAANDALMPTPGDSLLAGWTTLDNGAEYRVFTRRVDDASASQRRLYSITAEGSSGAGQLLTRRKLSTLLRVNETGDWPYLVVINGDAEMPGNPKFEGPCAHVHVNGDLDIGGSAEAWGDVTATGSITGSLYECESDGTNCVSTGGTPGADHVDIPDIDPMSLCGEADFIGRNGWLITTATSDSSDLRLVVADGWKYDGGPPARYVTDGTTGTTTLGTYCFDADAEISKNLGTKTVPFPLTVLAAGSVSIPGNPYLTGTHSGRYLVVAGGDVIMAGTPELGAENFFGLVYAGSQCILNGNPTIHGQLICADRPNPAGSEDYAIKNEISGSARIYLNDCSAGFGSGLTHSAVNFNWTQSLR